MLKIVGLTTADVSLARELNDGSATNNLLVKINGTNDQVRILGQFNSSFYAIEQIKFDDGTVWNSTVINAAPVTPTVVGTVQGSYGADIFDLRNSVSNTVYGANSSAAAYGNDTRSDTYIFGAGAGQDSINDYGNPAISTDTLKIVGLTPSEISLAHELNNGSATNNLLVKITGTTDQVRVLNQFSGTFYAIEQITFDNGTVWGSSVINAVI